MILITKVFIPKKIKAGYNKRSDTYTGKLAYLIYYDEKNKLRKETSWENWRNKDIDPSDYDNKPMSGFVLNKNAGGYKSNWNFRKSYTRVYDPRGFEIEITLENMLFILENNSSIKGKGLEGEYIYGWEGTDLVLIPTNTSYYKDNRKYSDLLFERKMFTGKDMILGATYMTKQGEEWIYLGRFDKYQYKYREDVIDTSFNISKSENKGKHYFFYSGGSYSFRNIETIRSLTNKIVDVKDENPVKNYPELMGKLEESSLFSPVLEEGLKYYAYTVEDLNEWFDSVLEVNSNDKLVYISNTGKTHPSARLKDGEVEVSYTLIEKNFRSYSGFSHSTKYERYDSIEDFIEKEKPKYLKVYLENGKLYRDFKFVSSRF